MRGLVGLVSAADMRSSITTVARDGVGLATLAPERGGRFGELDVKSGRVEVICPRARGIRFLPHGHFGRRGCPDIIFAADGRGLH